MQIMEKKYDVELEQLHGHEKIPCPEQVRKAGLHRYTTHADESMYVINADGEPELTMAAQKEYDGFVSKIKGLIESEDFEILDEGYGEGEDELEYHITAAVKDEPGAPIFHTVIEFQSAIFVDDDKGVG